MEVKVKMGRGAPNAYTGEEYGVAWRLNQMKDISFNNKTIVDIGCGAGGYCKKISDKNVKQIIGIDISNENIKKAKELCRKTNVYFIKACGEYLPIKTNSADIILSIEVLEHVYNPNQYLTECQRVSVKNAALLLSVPNKFCPFETHGMRLSKTSINNFAKIGIPFLSWLPNKVRNKLVRARIYNQKEITKTLLQNGYIVKKTSFLMLPLDGINSKNLMVLKVQQAIRRIESKIEEISFLRCLGVHLVCVAQKL